MSHPPYPQATQHSNLDLYHQHHSLHPQDLIEVTLHFQMMILMIFLTLIQSIHQLIKKENKVNTRNPREQIEKVDPNIKADINKEQVRPRNLILTKYAHKH